MENTTYKVLVPHDFTSVADTAVNHAAKIASFFNGGIYVLHIVAKDKEVEDAREKLNAIAQEASKTYNIKVEPIIRIGNIFEDIGDVATEIDARLIVMGTHGAKGIQKLVGSYALKVITHSKVPFIVVQNKKVREHGYKNIVVPIDSGPESKQKLTLTTNMAKHFGAKLHIITPNEKDEFVRKKLNQQLAFAKKYLEEKGVEYDVQTAAGEKSFPKEVIKFAVEIDADLIAVVRHEETSILSDLFSSNAVQDILANDAEIPVLIVNPSDVFLAGSILFR
jgi:nucleotide-binding universal stress UspA family protein